MASNEISFTSHWKVSGTPSEVYDVLLDTEHYVDWWPEVFKSVTMIEEGSADGGGKMADVQTKGVLPYHLRWRITIVEPTPPAGFTVKASGDLVGKGIWFLRAEADETAVQYDWSVRVEKPIVRSLAPVLRPLLIFNHKWAMARGQEGLSREMGRRVLRRRKTPADDF